MLGSYSKSRKIKALSYWRFVKLKKCQLSGAYPSFVGGTPIPRFPSSRPQVLGDIFHLVMRSLNELSVEEIRHPGDFRLIFNRSVESIGAKIQASANSRYLGDPKLWPELTGIYRSLCNMAEKKRNFQSDAELKILAEQDLYSKDGALFGQLDAYFMYANGIDIVDYKTGMITEGDIPKEEYVNQLYFYAYLIYENHGQYPKSLCIVGKDGTIIQIPPSLSRSIDLANEMRMVLKKYNDSLDSEISSDDLANPSLENCLFCEAKPMCSSFWKSLERINLPQWNHVAVGVQIKPIIRSKFGGSAIELSVEKSSLGTKSLRVIRIFENRYPDLLDKVGQRLLFLNLRQPVKENMELVEATERTVIVSLGSGI